MSPAMADMQAYPAYLLDKVRPAIGTRVIELGIGNGHNVMDLLNRGCHVLATDIDPDCLRDLVSNVNKSMHHAKDRLATAIIDLNEPTSLDALRSFRADSILTFNVLEHIANDGLALRALSKVVESQARIGIVVPAIPALYGRMDAEAGHFRRYTRKKLMQVLEQSGWKVESCCYINAIGAVGWWFHNRLRKSAGLQDPHVNQQMRAADGWLPRISRWTDPWLAKRFGLSVAAIATVGTSAQTEN
jgi:uncharacterized UPF0146 family protein